MHVELMDFEQRVSSKMRVESGFPGFPQPEQYNLTKTEIEDYLLDKQAILDSAGSQRTQYHHGRDDCFARCCLFGLSTKGYAWWKLGHLCGLSHWPLLGWTGEVACKGTHKPSVEAHGR